jgi:putative oxidoreductase
LQEIAEVYAMMAVGMHHALASRQPSYWACKGERMMIISHHSQKRFVDVGLLLIRTVLAAVFVFHGSQKLFGWFGGYGIEGTAEWMAKIGIPLPLLSTVVVGCVEFFGGIALLLGMGTRIAAIPMACSMLVAIATVHNSAFDARAGGMEFPLTLAVVLVALSLIGPGRLTVTLLLKRKREHRTAYSGVELAGGNR